MCLYNKQSQNEETEFGKNKMGFEKNKPNFIILISISVNERKKSIRGYNPAVV